MASMKIFLVYEDLELGRYKNHAYYMCYSDALKHLKQLRKGYKLFELASNPDKFGIEEINVMTYYHKSNVEYGNFNPKYIRITSHPTKDYSDFDFVEDIKKPDDVNKVKIVINSWCERGRYFSISPKIIFYIPYVRLPYDYIWNRVKKAGHKMILRVNSKINFLSYRGMNCMELEEAGFTIGEECRERWHLIERNVKSYYKKDTNKPDKIDLNYMYMCCPGAFNGSIDSSIHWMNDYVYKYIDV